MTIELEPSLADKGAAISLTDAERAELAALAGRLVDAPPGEVDHPAWLDHARDLSAELPARLRTTLRRFRREPGDEAVLVLHGLPVDPATLEHTPNRLGSVQRDATVPAAATALLALHLGELFAFREEKSGALVQNVVPVPGLEDTQGNTGSVKLTMHVENAFHPNRPDYVGLLCLRNDHENEAGLQVASVRRALTLLSPQTRGVLMGPRYRTSAPGSFDLPDGPAEPMPILLGDVADPDVRVDFASTEPLDEEAGEAMAALGDALARVSRTLVLSSGDLAFLDNRLCLHGRTAFRARYDGYDRWLQRVFVSLDYRRSRPLRAGDGHVVSGSGPDAGDQA